MKPYPRKKLRRRAWIAAFLVVLSFGIGCGSPTGIAIEALKYVGESDGSVNVDVTLDKVYTDTVTVQYASNADTATAGSDYDSTSGTLIFPPGETKQTITANILNDAIGESDEVFWLAISNPENANLKSGWQSCKITIIDDDNPPPTVQFTAATATVTEGTGTIALTVSLSALAPTAVTVKYATASGTALTDADFTTTAGTLTFALGETSKTITIPILKDSAPESTETFTVSLSAPSGATLGTQTSLEVTIYDDDAPPPVVPVTVVATGGNFSPDPAPVGTWVDVTLSAKAKRPDPGSATLGSPTWYWGVVNASYSSESETGPWIEGGSSYAIGMEPTSSPSPDGTYDYSAVVFSASFSVAGYWQLSTNAQASYSDSSSVEYVGAAIAQGKGVAIKVELTPSKIYMQSGGTAIMTAKVTPTSAAAMVTYSSRDTDIATVLGDAKYPTAIGVSAGTTKIDAKVSDKIAATADVNVFDISYSPQSGPVYSKVTFTIDTEGVNFFSAGTTIRIDAVFSPPEFDEEFFTVTHSGSKVLFDSGKPNEISLAVADVFPASFLTSENPGVTGSLIGSVRGMVTLTDGDKQITVNATFEITSAGTIGTLVDGVFQPQTDSIAVWQVGSAADLEDREPSFFQHAQIIRPANEFTTSPPSTISAQIKSVRADGTDVSTGVSVEFTLISSGAFHIYQSTKAFVFIDNTTYEGESSDLIAIAGEEDASVVMVRLPQ